MAYITSPLSSLSVTSFSLNATFPPFNLLPLVSVIVAVSVMFSPMYPVSLVTVILLSNFLKLTVYVVVVLLYWLFPSYVTVIVWFPAGSVNVCLIVPVAPVCVVMLVLSGSVIVIGA